MTEHCDVPTKPPPIRVLIVDDHAILREGLAQVLTLNGLHVVGDADNGESAVAMLDGCQPDVCLADLRMSPVDGHDFTRVVRERRPACKVIVLSAFDTSEDVYRAMQAGAASYVVKGTPSSRLVQTIREVHAGKKVFNAEIAERAAEHVRRPTLTPRQQEVLNCLAHGCSNDEIVSTLFISIGTVKTHVKAVLEKLGARDRTQAVVVAMQRGLVRHEIS